MASDARPLSHTSVLVSGMRIPLKLEALLRSLVERKSHRLTMFVFKWSPFGILLIKFFNECSLSCFLCIYLRQWSRKLQPSCEQFYLLRAEACASPLPPHNNRSRDLK